MTSDMPPTLEEPISKPTLVEYIPINNQINNIKIILFNINFKNFKKIYNHEKLNNVRLVGLIDITHPYISLLAVTSQGLRETEPNLRNMHTIKLFNDKHPI